MILVAMELVDNELFVLQGRSGGCWLPGGSSAEFSVGSFSEFLPSSSFLILCFSFKRAMLSFSVLIFSL